MEILFAFGFSVFCFWMANKLQKQENENSVIENPNKPNETQNNPMGFLATQTNLKPKKRRNYSEQTKQRMFKNLCIKFNKTGIMSINCKKPNETITKLHFGKNSFYNKNTFEDLRICRHYEGLAQRIYGTIEQSTNAFMCVLYLDLFGNWDNLDKKWSMGTIFPNAYANAFQEDLPMEKFEEIFLFNANSLCKSLQFKPPITPEQAWEKIKTYNP